MKRFIQIITFALVLFSTSVFAQNNSPKVIKYVAPKYPAAALAVRASGMVTVVVKINEDGKVTSATAESGHPLLRKACENAAKEWIFSRDSSIAERKLKVTFLLRIGDKNKKDKVKFRKPYTLELVGVRVRFVNTVDY